MVAPAPTYQYEYPTKQVSLGARSSPPTRHSESMSTPDPDPCGRYEL